MEKDVQIKEKLQFICREFRLKGDVLLWRWIPNGHINSAFYVALYDGKEVRQYLVQKVNWYVFKDPVTMMHNIDLITQHIMAKEPTLERRRRLHFHHTADGKNYLVLRQKDDGSYEALKAAVDKDGAEFWRRSSVCG